MLLRMWREFNDLWIINRVTRESRVERPLEVASTLLWDGAVSSRCIDSYFHHKVTNFVK